MSKNTCLKALEEFKVAKKAEKGEDYDVTQEEVVKLLRCDPLIDKMDPCLNELVNCRHLALSTNRISTMIDLRGFKNLEILSLGRNEIKVIKGLDAIGVTLKQLWISYNLIEKLDGLQQCIALERLLITNNKIKSWDELDKLNTLPALKEVSLNGNPIYQAINDAKISNNANFNYAPARSTNYARAMVHKKCPQLQIVDMLTIVEDEEFKKIVEELN